MIFRRKILKIFLFLIVVLLAYFAILIFKIYDQSRIDEAQKANAIVVLGAAQWNGNPSPVFQARLDYALSLYKQNYAPVIILTGGISEKESMSEAFAGKNYLTQKEMEKELIYIEEQGHTSWQSLNQVARILKKQNLNSIILVSDGFHMMRLKKMAKDLNIEAFGSPVKNSLITNNKLTEFKYILREAIVYIAYLSFKF